MTAIGEKTLKKLLLGIALLCAGARGFPQSSSEGEARAAETEILLDAAQERAGELLEAERQLAINMEESVPPAGGIRNVVAVFQVVITLALITLAVYGLAYVLKKSQGKKRGAEEDPHLKLLASVPLSVKASAVVVQAGNKAWLLGVSDAGVTLLSELNDQELIDTMILSRNTRTFETPFSGQGGFMRILRKMLPAQAATPPPPAEEQGTGVNGKLQHTRDKLRGL